MNYSNGAYVLKSVKTLLTLSATCVLLAACGGGSGGGGGESGIGSGQSSGSNLDSWGNDVSTYFGGGGGGGGFGSGDSGADGGAGDGAPIRNALVTIKDNSSPQKTATGMTDVDGHYVIKITGLTPPLIASVTNPLTGAVRYSPSVTPLKVNGFITINITGLTTFLAAQVAKTVGAAGAENLTPAVLAANQTALTGATTALRDELNSKLSTSLKAEVAGLGLNLATFDPVTAQYIPSTTSGYDTILENVAVSSTATTITVKTPLELAKAMFAELRTTWNTALTGMNAFLNSQTTRASNDIDANVMPSTSRLTGHISTLMKAVAMFDDGKAYATNPFDLTPTTKTPDGTPGLMRSWGSPQDAWFGRGTYTNCWTDSPTGVTSKAYCSFIDDEDSADRVNNLIRYLTFEVTSSATGQYTYTARRYNQSVSFNSFGQPIFGATTRATTDAAGNTMPTGSGTLSKTTSGSSTTGLIINGTIPPSRLANAPTEILTTGVDTIAFNTARLPLTAANTYRYTLTGSVSASKLAAGTSGATDPTKVVSMSFDNGSYVDVDETNKNTTGDKALIAKLIGTVQTTATKFTGTFDLSAPMSDADGLGYAPTNVVFNGGISDISSGGAGQFLSGVLTMNVSNYKQFRSTLPDTASNYAQWTATFTGSLQAPSRPLMQLVTDVKRTGLNTSDVKLSYSYGKDVLVTGTTTDDNAKSIKPTLTLTNQNGVVVVFDTQLNTGTVSVPGATPAQQATIGEGRISYIDGVTESLN